jgi:antitoxin component of MazEF toxin-antitoxin module
MQVQIQKTDQGLMIPIPEDLVQKSKFSQDSMVNITFENDRFVVAHPDDPYYTIEELLEGMTEANLHEEIRTGPPRGNEVW